MAVRRGGAGLFVVSIRPRTDRGACPIALGQCVMTCPDERPFTYGPADGGNGLFPPAGKEESLLRRWLSESKQLPGDGLRFSLTGWRVFGDDVVGAEKASLAAI